MPYTWGGFFFVTFNADYEFLVYPGQQVQQSSVKRISYLVLVTVAYMVMEGCAWPARSLLHIQTSYNLEEFP